MSTFERHTLDNGLRVLTSNLDHAQSVTCMVMLAAGSRYETPDTNGIAHFSEHMFFKGTERRPTARDIAGEIDAIGGEFNAFTGKEYTAYYVKCAAEHRDVALDVLVDMLRNSRFDAEEIEREKGVIIEEMNMYFDTPRDYIGGVYESSSTATSRSAGTSSAARRPSATRRATRSWAISTAGTSRRAWSSASRAASATTRSSACRSCSATSPTRPTGEPEPARGYQNGRVSVFTKQSDQAHLILGVPSYPIEHPDRYALQMVATVLGGGMSSRLFTEVRERRGLAYYVFGMNHSYTDAGSLYSQAGVDINRIDEAVDDDRVRAEEDRRRAGARRRAREGAQLHEGPVRPAAREPAGADHVRRAQGGARGTRTRSRGSARRASTR